MDERKYRFWSNHSMCPELLDKIRINWANELSKQRGPSLKDDVFFKVKLVFFNVVKVNQEFTQNSNSSLGMEHATTGVSSWCASLCIWRRVDEPTILDEEAAIET